MPRYIPSAFFTRPNLALDRAAGPIEAPANWSGPTVATAAEAITWSRPAIAKIEHPPVPVVAIAPASLRQPRKRSALDIPRVQCDTCGRTLRLNASGMMPSHKVDGERCPADPAGYRDIPEERRTA